MAACVLPIMIAATVSVLQLGVAWPYVAWGLPGAFAVATLWTYFTLGRRLAEVRVQRQTAALRSVLDVLYDRPPDWEPLFDVRVTPDTAIVAVGWDSVRFARRDWPRFDALQDALQHARHSASTPSSSHA